MTILKNTLKQLEQRRKNQRSFNDAPVRIDIGQSIRELRRIYPYMTDRQFSKWYEKKYRVKAEEVLLYIAVHKEMS